MHALINFFSKVLNVLLAINHVILAKVQPIHVHHVLINYICLSLKLLTY